MPPPWLKNVAMSPLRAINAAESAMLIASIDDPTMIALYLWVVSGIALKAARLAVGQVTSFVPPAAPAFASALATLPPDEQSTSNIGRDGTGAPPRT